MKKLFLFSVAALSFCACSNDTVVSDSNSTVEPKEISFAPLAKPNTRAAAGTQPYAIDGDAFPVELDMYVAAYQVQPTPAADFFTGTKFIYKAGGAGSYARWGAETAKYWPMSSAYINFLAYANLTGTAKFGDQLEPAVASASKAVVTQTDNSEAQTDLIYAIGSGEVTQDGSNLTFPDQVNMVFKHAQAWMEFDVKASTVAPITINSITLKGAKYAGTYTITHTNYNAKTGKSVAGVWSDLAAAKDVTVPGWEPTTEVTTTLRPVGHGLLVVPDDDATTNDWTSFVVNYTLDGNDYNYEYTAPAAPAANLQQGKHYVYNITFTSHEILLYATVTDWEDVPESHITAQTEQP